LPFIFSKLFSVSKILICIIVGKYSFLSNNNQAKSITPLPRLWKKFAFDFVLK